SLPPARDRLQSARQRHDPCEGHAVSDVERRKLPKLRSAACAAAWRRYFALDRRAYDVVGKISDQIMLTVPPQTRFFPRLIDFLERPCARGRGEFRLILRDLRHRTSCSFR